MHSKVKGNIGEMAVALHLIKEGFPVFTELGDNSRTDLVALVDGRAVKIQVKARNMNRSVVTVENKKSGPNYSFKYQSSDVDVFAIYITNTEGIFFVSALEFTGNKSCISFRETLPKSSNQYETRLIRDYSDIRKAL